MNKLKHSKCGLGFLLTGACVVLLAGCTTYIEPQPPQAVYAPPQPGDVPSQAVPVLEAPVVVIQSESDFYEPLSAQGSWVDVESYGRCWRPARVDAGWRPYSNGHWQRTDSGWYWASDEPWAWATYHYGRWDWKVELGWIWVPQIQWAPAWVSWRQGAGYIGWAPLPPAVNIGSGGIVQVPETPYAPRAFVFVNERQLLEPVRPATVVVNNTTVINQTVNITKITVVNKTVINEGPRPELLEQKNGRKIPAVPVRELRRREETEAVTRQRDIPASTRITARPPADTRAAPPGSISAPQARPAGPPVDATKERPRPAQQNEIRGVAGTGTPGTPRARVVVPPKGEEVPGLRQTKPAAPIVPLVTRRPSDASNPPQPGVGNTRVPGARGPNLVEKPIPPRVATPMGNERQRGLERVKTPPVTERPVATKPGVKPVEPRKAATKVKPIPSVRTGKPSKQNDEKKKGDDQETPIPATPVRPPR